MLKKILSIVLILTMLFALTGCNMLVDILDNVLDGKEEAPSNELLLPEGEYYYFGEGFEEGDGSIRIEIETDEEGNLIGKLEQIDPDASIENNEPIINKEPEKNNAGLKTLKGTAVSHMGKTINEIKALYGDHIETNGSGMFYYSDRLNGIQFYVANIGDLTEYTGDEVVIELRLRSANVPVADGVSGNESKEELLSLFDGSPMPGDGNTIMIRVNSDGREYGVVYEYNSKQKTAALIWVVQ